MEETEQRSVSNQMEEEQEVEQEEDEEQELVEHEDEEEEEEKKTEDLFESTKENIFHLRRRQANIRNQISEVPCQLVSGMVCSSVVYQNNYVFMGTSGNCVFCYNISTQKTSQLTFDFDDWVLSLEIITLDGVDLLAAGGGLYDRSICFYDLTEINRGVISLITQKQVHAKSITKILFVKEQNLLLTCGSDNRLKIWTPSMSVSKFQRNQNRVRQQRRDEEIRDINDEREDNEVLCRKVNLKLKKLIQETAQLYSICQTDEKLIVYGTGCGLIKVILANDNGSAKELRSFKVLRSVWCLQRFLHLRFVVGFSYQTEGRINVLNVVTGQYLYSIFSHNESIYYFQIIYKKSKMPRERIAIKNKQEFIDSSSNLVSLVGISKLGMIKVCHIGDKSKPTEYTYSYDQNIMWIPWSPLNVIPTPNKKELEVNCSEEIKDVEKIGGGEEVEGEVDVDVEKEKEEEEEEVEEPFEKVTVICSTGNQQGFTSARRSLFQMVSFDLCI